MDRAGAAMTPEAVLNGQASRGWGPARQTLRVLLARQAALAFAPPVLDALISRVRFTCSGPGQEVAASDDAPAAVHIVVGGVVKIVCEGAHGKPVVAHMAGPGGVLHLPAGSRGTVRRVWVAAHTTALVASLAHADWLEVACHMRVEDTFRLVSCAWQSWSVRLCEKCVLLALPVRARVLHELQVLARDFGSPHPAGVCIDLPLSHADLAALVGAARANVTRALGALRATGVLAAVPGRLVLTAAAS